MSIYVQKDELNSTYAEAARVAEDWYKPFNEYERIAGNKLSKQLAKNMPRVNDGSLASSLIETPMRVFPSMQPGKFTAKNRKEPWLNELANIIWKTKILPNANTQASFFDKELIAIYRALKYGAQPRYNFFVSNDTYTGSDWSLPYIRNVKLEPGKFAVEDCDYIFLDVYFTKLQLKRIIEQNKKDKDSTWNTKNLKTLADMAMTSKEMEEQNINERDKQVSSSGIKTTICFNRGAGAPFYMFSKHLPDGDLLREWKNEDPTGDLPITMQYAFENLESPYGVGRVELAGPTQNVLDYMTQAHVLATQLGLQPPKKIKGSIDNLQINSLVQAPDATWITGNAEVEIVQNTNSVYTNFPTNYGIYKGQLQTLQGQTDGSVSASSGNPSFSKTQAGVQMQQERTNAQDNYLRNKADSASSKMATKMMNTHMAMMKGADILEVAEEDVERLHALGYFDEDPMTPAPSVSELEILYDDLRTTFTFEYDPRPEADDEEKNRWLELIDIVTSNPNFIPMLQAAGWNFDLGEAFKKVISASGTDGWDKVLTKVAPEELGGQPQIDPATGMPIQPEIDPMTGQPIDPMAQGMPMEAPMEQMAQLPPEVLDTMELYDVDQDIAMAVLEARNQGFDEGEILEFLRDNGEVA